MKFFYKQTNHLLRCQKGAFFITLFKKYFDSIFIFGLRFFVTNFGLYNQQDLFTCLKLYCSKQLKANILPTKSRFYYV